MHRFRKKSDAKKSHLPILPPLQVSFTAHTDQEKSFELPSADDFRTSLILPDLSRRFSLLRNSSGDPLPLDLLRSRLAEQRARGAENQVSEEEEEMILESLGLRTKYSSKSQENVTEDAMRQSLRSTNSSISQAPSSGRSTKRYSNNLFGSGRLRDYSYVRTATQGRHAGSRTTSTAPSESSLNPPSLYSNNLRPVTPEASGSSSIQSSPDEKRAVRSASSVPPSPYGEQPMSAAEYRISKTLGSSALKRASLALEEAIREIEEDVEDEIVMPRSVPISRQNADQHSMQQEPSSSRLSDVYEAGMAISPDTHHRPEKEERRASPVPSRILPGYIPGMPRPMTPREDDELLRSHSTTPRAMSPSSPSKAEASSPVAVVSPNLASGLLRNNSSASFSRQSSRPTSPSSPPMFLQRSPATGHYSPDALQRGERSADGAIGGNYDTTSVPSRRRPASPLSGPSYQPFTAAAGSTSRPGTPSNVTWTFPSNPSPQKATEHNRNGSWFSDAEAESTDTHPGASSYEHSKSGSRSLRSPALPDSPLIGRGHTNAASFSSNYSGTSENRPSSAISGIDLNSPHSSPITSRVIRSPTPTSKSPTSPIFPGLDMSPRNTNRRSSKQNTPSSAFSSSPYGPVVFSPLVNSSRSSLESDGSSYHSWEGDQKERLYSILDADSQQPAWHDISFPSQSSSTTPGGSPDAEWDAEDIINRYGLHKSDFSAIQEKLVGVANAKTSVVAETRDRAPSLRRRRPSTSQSNYSLNGRDVRVASPSVQALPSTSQTADTLNNDQVSKASALLNSVVNSINTQTIPSPLQTSSPPLDADIASSTSDVSPTTRRNRDLAQVLFGMGHGEEATKESSDNAARSLPSEDARPLSDPVKEVQPTPSSSSPPLSAPPFSSPNPAHSPDASSFSYSSLRSPSTPRIHQTPEAEAELAREVQRKTDAAMVALKKKPSNPNLSREALTSPGSTRKKINPNQISTPTLVSASTSVDTIPLRTPPLSSGPPSKIGSRFRKLRGTLKKGNTPEGMKLTPYPLDIRSPVSTQSQFAQYDPQKLNPVEPAASATELGPFKVPSVPVPSPPASAGPGLKGFMARFRGKQRHDSSIDYKAPSQRFSPAPYTTSFLQDRPAIPHLQVPNDAASSSRDFNTQFSYPQRGHHSEQPSSASEGVSDSAGAHESMAIRQLFDAAENLGLDQRKLSELLVRSGSTSSRSTDWTMLTRNNSNVARLKPDSRSETQLDNLSPRSDWTTFEDAGVRESKPLSRKSSLKQPQPPPPPPPPPQPENVGIRRPRQQTADATNTIVRRTIIFPDTKGMSAADLNALVRKGSNRRRRASAMSATSVSSRSVHERVPTPPPPRSPTGRRFSEDNSPPVPQLPVSLMSRIDQNLLNVPSPTAGGPVEKSSSAYDSLYEMYAGEIKQANVGIVDTGPSAQRDGPSDHGPALEVIELANGEMIWSIVNGLRDDDLESVYTGRASFQSEYDNEESVQVFVKDHTRAGSKGSNSSLFSRKKQGQGKIRPETKVFYSSSAQIGRLIENLSQGMDAGTFNFSHNAAAQHSAASSISGQTTSDVHLTVEERLERMLGAMRTS